MSGRPSIAVRKRALIEKIKDPRGPHTTPPPINRMQRRQLARAIQRDRRAAAATFSR